jgi:uncharacterized repeat protein (TIGR02543 family)
MKKTWLNVLICLVVLASVFTIFPTSVMADSGSGYFTYTVSGSDATITGYIGPGGAIDVPGTITDGVNTYNVTCIGDGAFFKKLEITSVTLPSGLTSIGSKAFYNCSNLASVNLPDSLISIGDEAFTGCYSLTFTSITLPDGLISIGQAAFTDCRSLVSITLPDDLTAIRQDTFTRCSSLASITLPGNLTSIGNSAFSGCSGLISILIPDNVTSIGVGAFAECANLTSINLPDGLISLGEGAFDDCTNLAFITLPGSLTSIGPYTFYNCSNLTFPTLPGSLTSIGDYAFVNCEHFTSVNLPGSLTYLGDYAFAGCSNLNAAYFYGAMPGLGDNIFSGSASGFTLYYHVSQTASWSSYAGYPSAPFCVLTLDNQDGSSPASEIAVVDGSGHIAAPADPARPGYTFNGWYQEPACTNAFDFSIETVTGDVFLYAGWTAYGQMWLLDSETSLPDGTPLPAGVYEMEKSGGSNDNGQTPSVNILGGQSVIFVSDQTASSGVSFPNDTWIVEFSTTMDWASNCQAQVGSYNLVSGKFNAFSSAATGSYDGGYITIAIDAGGDVPAGDYLALRIFNKNMFAQSVVTDGSSYLSSPYTDPGYPMPELAAGLLLTLGLAGLGSVIIIRRKKLA